MAQYPTAPIDVDGMEQMPCGEHRMSERLRQLGWDKTEQFFAYAIYIAKGKRIGVTIYQPHIAPCAHTHYALPLA
jgi:hypothetical protein